MKTSMYICGSIEALVGAVLLWLTKMAAETAPILGRIAFQVRMAGSYGPSDYAMDLSTAYRVGIVLIIAGILQILLSILMSIPKKK